MTTNTTKNYELIRLNDNVQRFRIKALRDIPKHNVKKGDWGGVVESELNLSQKEEAWIAKDSEVTGYARVFNGYVCGASSISGHTEIRSGYIKNSILKGETIIGGLSDTIMIVNSELENCSFHETTRIKDSKIENAYSTNHVDMEKVDVTCNDKLSLWGKAKWKEVKYTGVIATFQKESNLSHVEVSTPLFTSETKVNVEFAKLHSEELIIISAWKNNQSFTTELHGDENGNLTCDVQKLNIRESSIYGGMELLGNLFFLRSTLEGNIRIDGEVLISDSKIVDSVTIQAYDLSLKDCTLSDMSSISQKTQKEIDIEKLCLSLDETYIC